MLAEISQAQNKYGVIPLIRGIKNGQTQRERLWGMGEADLGRCKVSVKQSEF